MSVVQAIITMSVPTLAIIIGIFIDGLLIAKCRRQMGQMFDQTIRRMDQTIRHIELRLKQMDHMLD